MTEFEILDYRMMHEIFDILSIFCISFLVFLFILLETFDKFYNIIISIANRIIKYQALRYYIFRI